jgi:hypothetical protein
MTTPFSCSLDRGDHEENERCERDDGANQVAAKPAIPELLDRRG